jgi:hypothetical protein
MDDNKLNEKLLAQMTDKLLETGEREHLDMKVVNRFVALLQYIFRKDPNRKDDKCMLCQD